MRYIKNVFVLVLIAVTLLIGIGYLICAYSPYISPVAHPYWACAGLFFPIFVVLVVLCIVAWLILKPRIAVLPVVIRAPQADSVAQAIEENRSRYMLVCGDFNDSPISYAHHKIGRGMTDAFSAAGTGFGFSYNQNRFYFRIDHIFSTPAFRVVKCEVDRSIKASDHYPIWCLLEK